MALTSTGPGDYCHFSRLPRELRDRIYDFTCQDTTSLVLVSPTLFTHVLFTALPELSLLRVCRQIREEVQVSVARQTSATTLDAWDCQGAYDPLQRRNHVPRVVLESVRDVEVVLPTWTAMENDLALVEAILNYVRGVQCLSILFNNPSLAQAKIQQFKGCEVKRSWNIGTRQNDLYFRRTKSQPPSYGVDDEQNEELLLRRWTNNDDAATAVMIKSYVSGKWNEDGVYIPGHYAEV